jgi:hypothetical protein
MHSHAWLGSGARELNASEFEKVARGQQVVSPGSRIAYLGSPPGGKTLIISEFGGDGIKF